MKKYMFTAAAVLASAAGLANAQSYNGPGFTISDVAVNSSTLAVDAAGPLSTVEVSFFGIQHTWFADLTCYLTAPNGDVLNLFHRPNTSGDPSGTYNFSDSASAAVTASDLAGGTFLAQGGTFSAAFGGDEAGGIWRLNIDDLAGGDVGSISGWQLRINTVPTPGAAALVGFAGLAAFRRRRA